MKPSLRYGTLVVFSFGTKRTPDHNDVRRDISGRRHSSLGVFETSYAGETPDRYFGSPGATHHCEVPFSDSYMGAAPITKTVWSTAKRRDPVEIRSRKVESSPGLTPLFRRRQTESQGSLGASGRRTRTF